MELPPDLDTWTYETIAEIVSDYEYEPGYFDYKAQLNATKGEHRERLNQSIRKTAGAMANTGGGYLLFGVEDRAVVAPTPLARIKGIPLDGDLRLQFGDKLKATQPAIHFESIGKPIPLPNDATKGIFVVYLPESLRRPHMTNPEGVFYRRDSGGNAVAMDYYQVRDMMMFRRPALLANLRWELEEAVIALTTRYKSEAPFPILDWIAKARRTIALPDRPFRELIPLNREQTSRMSMFWTLSPRANRIRTTALQQALHSGEFLVLRSDTGKLASGQVHDAMQVLLQLVEQFQGLDELLAKLPDQLAQLHEAARSKSGTSIRADTIHILFHFHDRQQDILRIVCALLDYIADPSAELRMPTLNPINPIAEEARRIAAERVTHADVQRWLNDPAYRRFLTPEPLATAQGLTGEGLASAMQQSPILAEIFGPLIEEIHPYLAEYSLRKSQDGEQAAMAWLQSILLARTAQ